LIGEPVVSEREQKRNITTVSKVLAEQVSTYKNNYKTRKVEIRKEKERERERETTNQMADILIQPAVPSLFIHTESASNLIVDSPTADSNNNTTIHHSCTSPNNNSHDVNNHSNNSHTTNKYIGHVSRLRSVFTQYALTLNDLKPGEHRSRYANHQQQGLGSPTRGIADGSDDHSPSPPLPSLPLATTSSSTLIERSRSLSNPRILESATTNLHSLRSGLSSLTVSENPTAMPSTNSNDDHTMRFRKAKEMFQTLEEEAARTVISSSSSSSSASATVIAKPFNNHRSNDPFNDDSFQPDFMHDASKLLTPKLNSEHIPDLIIDHRQQQQQQQHESLAEQHDLNAHRMRDIPIQYVGTPPASSPSSSDMSFISVPVHRSTPPVPVQVTTSSLLITDDVPYAMINRKVFNTDQHYDFPKETMNKLTVDDTEHLTNDNHHECESTTNVAKPSNEEIADRIVASILPSNILKRMDHLNTKFIKPTVIEQNFSKLSFQDNETSMKTDENDKSYQTIEIEQEEPTWIENPMLNGML
jgi:hypothetical protein